MSSSGVAASRRAAGPLRGRKNFGIEGGWIGVAVGSGVCTNVITPNVSRFRTCVELWVLTTHNLHHVRGKRGTSVGGAQGGQPAHLTVKWSGSWLSLVDDRPVNRAKRQAAGDLRGWRVATG